LDDDLTLHASPLVRGLFVAAGAVCVVVGVVGIVVPIMPTVPFLIVAAACFARGSPACYRRLVASPTFGPSILEWRRYRCIRWRTKLTALALLGVSLAASILLFVRPLWLQCVVALLGLAVGVYLYRIPSRDRPPRR
jgi:uncharacterized protein